MAVSIRPLAMNPAHPDLANGAGEYTMFVKNGVLSFVYNFLGALRR